ncbi:MAG: protein-L-isoaspartate(D-aspartate) O-methyltransferase [Candidatus Dadabacteria bacterium]|nr:MAG: protein-L-isoaspartate(D-aspartate) O-methyltransferase [Candidatus Dadabacteria bacterium]
MVKEQLESREISDPAVLDAMRKIPRHLFVPEHFKDKAYSDCALPIGEEQSISQPYVIALMLQELKIDKDCRVLEIGTGSGYQTALLASICKEVYSLELDASLVTSASRRLDELGLNNVEIRWGNGYNGWPEKAPFDRIIVSAASKEIPRELVRELKVGGRMILPLGKESQELVLIIKNEQGLESEALGGVRFVEMKKV